MGLTILDAGVVIAFFDATDAHHESAANALRDARARNDRVALPASALAEALVWPARRGDDAIRRMQMLVARFPIDVVVLDEPIAEAAARIRARLPQLRLPDALVVATAHVLDADVLLTTDRRWPDASALGLRGELVAL